MAGESYYKASTSVGPKADVKEAKYAYLAERYWGSLEQQFLSILDQFNCSSLSNLKTGPVPGASEPLSFALEVLASKIFSASSEMG